MIFYQYKFETGCWFKFKLKKCCVFFIWIICLLQEKTNILFASQRRCSPHIFVRALLEACTQNLLNTENLTARLEGSILRNGVLTKLAQRYLDWVKRGTTGNASFVGLWQGMGGLWSTKVTNSCIHFISPCHRRFFLLNCIFLSTIIGPSLVYVDYTKFANVKWLPGEFFQSAFGIS